MCVCVPCLFVDENCLFSCLIYINPAPREAARRFSLQICKLNQAQYHDHFKRRGPRRPKLPLGEATANSFREILRKVDLLAALPRRVKSSGILANHHTERTCPH